MKHRGLCVLAFVLAFASLAAGPPGKEEPEHKELRDLRDAMLKAFDKGDVDGLLEHVHPDVVATWQNGETVRGHAGVRKFYEEMMGPTGKVKQMTSKLTPDELSLLYNDKATAVAFGKMDNHFDLRDGMSFDLHSRWTASLVKDKEKGKFKIVSFHISTNMFDNGVMSLILSKSLLWTGVGAGAAGLLAGVLGGVMLGRRKKAAV